MVHEDRIAFDGAGHVRAHALRIRVHLPHLLRHRLGIVGEIDGVAVALAHLPVVQPGQPRNRRQQRLRLDEHLAVELMETADRFARQLQVRDLILPDRHEPAVVERDVCRLQQRIAEEPERRQILVGQLFLLLLVGRAPARARESARPSTASAPARRARARATG